MEPKEAFIYWVQVRDAIRIKKEAGDPKPWSPNPVMQRTYFCNVHREDDKVTRWIRKHYTLDFFGENYEAAICAARIFNWPSTLEGIQDALKIGDFEFIKKKLLSWQNLNWKVWSGAYLITTHGRRMSKLDYCMEILEAAYHHPWFFDTRTCREWHEHIMCLEGFGSFLAAQVVADLKNTKGHPLASAPDWQTFSAPGPGSLRGLSWFHGEKVTPSTYQTRLDAARLEVGDKIPKMCDQDLQNCFCEYDKFMRVTEGTGRSKRKYEGI